MMDFLNYLGGLFGGNSSSPVGRAEGPNEGSGEGTLASPQPSFMQNLGGALGRSQQAGGGAAGLVAALSPDFSKGYASATPAPQGAPGAATPLAPAATGASMSWGQQPNGPQKGLSGLVGGGSGGL